MAELGVWIDEDGSTWVVASSEADALLALRESTGETPGEGDDGYGEWTRIADERPLSIWCDAAGEPCEMGDGSLTARPCGEWAKRGRGFLCTTNA